MVGDRVMQPKGESWIQRNELLFARFARCSVAILLTFALSHSAVAQLSVNSSPNTVGSGARALGMGGAFIAVADDATAASWNPGGLTQLESPEFSIVYAYKHATEEFSDGYHLWTDGEFETDLGELNYLSIAYPFQRTIAGRNLVVSLNYQRKFNFDRNLDFQFKDYAGLTGGNIFDIHYNIDYYQYGSLSTISPAFGFEITNKLSAGVVMNIWDSSLLSDNGWYNKVRFRSKSGLDGALLGFSSGEIINEYEDFDATNYTFGMLYRPIEGLQIGAVYNSGFAADVKYTQTARLHGVATSINRENRRMEFPTSYGIGVAYRFPNDKLTLSLDVTKRLWDHFVEVDQAGRRTSPITGISKKISYIEPTYTVRAGAEYVFIDTSKPVQKYMPSVRAGAFYDPEPAGGRNDGWLGLGKVTGDPDKYYGVTLGGGVLIKNRVNVDFAYQYRWGNDVRQDTFAQAGVDADAGQHEFYLSTVVYLGKK
jgi:long-subunit fatty acid transport protein